jgi:6-pyruvoyltetrahydropterin/6-carboxytetrahydropterin synthase
MWQPFSAISAAFISALCALDFDSNQKELGARLVRSPALLLIWIRGIMVYLTRKAEFAASHYYHNPDFTPEENLRLFGKCNNSNGHGHNYTLEVTVKGEVNPRSGFVVDLKQLKEVMHREVLDAMDHRFLNKEVPEFFTRIPTTENLAIAIWQRLETKLQQAQLHRVRVYETPDLFVDFYGED